MAESFAERLDELLERLPPASTGDWADLARDLRREHFNPILALLDREQPKFVNALQLAFQTFASLDADFCRHLCGAIIQRKDDRFRAGASTFANRIALRAVAGAAKGRTKPDSDLLGALAFHRMYHETVSGVSTVGHDVRLELRHHFALMTKYASAFEFVSPFRFILCATDKPTAPFAEAWDDKAFLIATLTVLAESATRTALTWVPDVPLSEQPLYLLADALAFVVSDPYPYGGTARKLATDSLLQTVERAVQIWSSTYAKWTSTTPATVDAPACLRSESFLHGLIEHLKFEDRRGLMGPQAAKAYRDWIDLCGGYDVGICDDFLRTLKFTVSPTPSYERDWARAEQLGRPQGSNLLFSAAPYHFVRHIDLLRKPDSQDREESTQLTNTDYLQTVSDEIWAIAVAQGLVPKFDLLHGDVPTTALSPLRDTAHFFPEKTIARDQLSAALHPDHRRALGIMAAAVLQWRADISYRTVGPRVIVTGFSAEQHLEIDRARQLYVMALALIGGEVEPQDDSFVLGLGIIGSGLNARRQSLRDECRMRLRQIDLGQDWSAAAIEWPLTYLEDIQLKLEEMLRFIEGAAELDALKGRQTDLTLAVEERRLAIVQAEEMAQAADKIVEAETFTLDALKIEEAAATIRRQIAGFRKTEAQYQAAARKYARASTDEKAQAQAALEQIERETERQFGEQVQVLRFKIHELTGTNEQEGTLPRIRRQIGEARQQLAQFEQGARDRRKEKQSRQALVVILKKIGSLVSMYYTGVDLVTIADTTIQAVKSAESGDWAAAIAHAKDASDLATGGKFSAALNRDIAAAERYIGSVMADSLNDAAKVIEAELGIEKAAATALAVEAVARQALRIGVSYLATETGTRDIFIALGVPEPSAGLIPNLREAAEKQLLNAIWQAFAKTGAEAVKGLALVLAVQDTSDAEKELYKVLREAAQAGRSVERTAIKLISDVEQSHPQAKAILSELKNELLEQRDQLAIRFAREARKTPADVAQALDGLAAKTLGVTQPESLPLPPIAMPAEVTNAIRDFRRQTEAARVRIGFLTTPGKADELANRLSDVDDETQFNDNLGRVVAELTNNVTDAERAIEDAEDDLGRLSAKLTEAQVEAYKAHFREQAAHWQTLAAKSDAQAAAEVANAAGEAVLAAVQQIRIEEFGIESAQRRAGAQQSLLAAKKHLANSAKTEIEIRTIALRRVQGAALEWNRINGVLNPDQRRIAQAVKLWSLNKANTLLAQWWQLLNLYEVTERLQRLADPPQNYAPTFLIPDTPKIRLGQMLLTKAESQWNTGLLEGPRLLTTIQFDAVRGGLSLAEQEKLRGFFTKVGGQLFPCLTLQGRQDVRRLVGGITFQIRADRESSEIPFYYLKDLPLSAFTDAVTVDGKIRQQTGTTFLESDVFPAWDDTRSPRIRLLGVLLDVIHDGGLRQGAQLNVYLRQEAEPHVWVRDTEIPGGRRRVLVPLAAMKSEDDLDRGVYLSVGAFTTPQWQTRPLFGTYTVRIGNKLRDFTHPLDFQIQIHFVALGRP